jgi:integrase
LREWEWIDTMPAFKTYARGGTARVRWLTHSQAERLLNELPEHQQDMMLFALATGLRQRNVRELSWDQVDLARRQATIEGTRPKNGQWLRVPLNELAMSVLERRKGKHAKWVFTYCGKPIRQVNTKCWKDALKRCGIRDFRWHDLRHTWASWLRQQDVPT